MDNNYLYLLPGDICIHMAQNSWKVKSTRPAWAWSCMPTIAALGRLRQEDHEFDISLGCVVKSYLKKH
jgi:hypothetical protein